MADTVIGEDETPQAQTRADERDPGGDVSQAQAGGRGPGNGDVSQAQAGGRGLGDGGVSQTSAADGRESGGGASRTQIDGRGPGGGEVLQAQAGGVDSGEDEVPATDERDPGLVLGEAIGHALALIGTWERWDGVPIAVEDRVYTPHKAVRRIVDHLIDHLGEVEARVVGGVPMDGDDWQASAITTLADLAPFGAEDRREAEARVGRLGQVWVARLGGLGAVLDQSPGRGWSVRQIAFHLADSIYYYADAVGPLG